LALKRLPDALASFAEWEKVRNFALDERFVDDHLCGDVRQFTSLPRFHLLSHRLKVSLHTVNTN
jgi:hypothetical protein